MLAGPAALRRPSRSSSPASTVGPVLRAGRQHRPTRSPEEVPRRAFGRGLRRAGGGQLIATRRGQLMKLLPSEPSPTTAICPLASTTLPAWTPLPNVKVRTGAPLVL
ncbi:hypothetical protein ACVW07_003696 [Cellulomonas sp. URHB0016]